MATKAAIKRKVAAMKRPQKTPVPVVKSSKPGHKPSMKAGFKSGGQKPAGGKKPAHPGKKPAAHHKPKPPTAEVYAQRDPDYRRAVAGYRTNLANMSAQNRANRSDLTADFTSTRNRLMQSFDQNNKAQQSDFAARGLYGSGVYAKANNDRQTNETNQVNDATTSYQRNARQLDTDLANSRTLERQQESTAKAAAIRRASARYGITGAPAPVHKPKGKPVRRK